MAKNTSHPFKRKRRLFGRRKSRPLGKTRQKALDTLLPKLGIAKERVAQGTTIPVEALFPQNFQRYCMEIGFGNGTHLAGLMERHPDTAFIGAEPFVNGMSAFLKKIRKRKHNNIRVWMDDALLLIDVLAPRSLDRIYLLNPDPWPKKRHHKRRFINHETLEMLSQVLKPGAKLIMTTDVADLADWMVAKTITHPAFEWTAEKADDWREAPPDWIKTKYEKKGEKAGRQQVYLIFRRKTGYKTG